MDLPIKDGEALPETCLSLATHQNFGPISMRPGSTAQWFAAYTAPRHEKHVADLLAEREIETFLPLYKAARHWKKSSPVVLELPLFPSYVFVRVEKSARGTVLGLPGVLSIVGSSKEPWPLPAAQIEALRLGLEEYKAEPHSYIAVGERVRIKAGVMSGVEGILFRKKNLFRFIISLDAMMKSVALEVDASDLEPADLK
jgi:transcription antitermination factor NusG